MICKECAWEADMASRKVSNPGGLGGHHACTGCDCQHKPIKEGQINGSAQ